MGKKKRRFVAQQTAHALGFTVQTRANVTEIIEVLNAAAAAAGTGGLRGTFRRLGFEQGPKGFRSNWELRGPGGLAQMCSFVVNGDCSPSSAFVVTMQLQKFNFTGNNSKANIGGAPTLRLFGEVVTRELRASASAGLPATPPLAASTPSATFAAVAPVRFAPPTALPATAPVIQAPSPLVPPKAQANPARWAADPFGRFELRYWDGGGWTDHVSQEGITGVDPAR